MTPPPYEDVRSVQRKEKRNQQNTPEDRIVLVAVVYVYVYVYVYVHVFIKIRVE